MATGGAETGGLLWWMALRLFPALGSDGATIYLRDHQLKVQGYSPEDALLSRRTLKLGRRFVGVANGYGRSLYDRAHFDLHTRPLIDPARQVGEWRMFIEAMQSGHGATWLTLLALIETIFYLL